ncbi:MAG TPA: ketopantoate reductase family protein [Chloroflexi bacterium]|nr:ketopantoate reductase family protein [Chloroflexota bacterium]
MRILIYGAGVVASFYAAQLARGGHEVSILARGQRLADIQEHGILLEELETGRRTTTPIKAVEHLQPDEAYDLVLVIVRANQVSAVLPPLAANQHTPNVVFVGNNVAGPAEMIEALGHERVLLGFGGIGGVRKGPVILHTARPDDQPASILLGELDGQVTPRLQWIARHLESAGLEVTFSPHIEAWLKTHVALVSPIACAIYMAGGDNYRLAHTRDGLVLLIRAVREGFRVLRARGIPIMPPAFRLLGCIPEPLLVSGLRRLFDTEFAAIGMAGHANVARDEFEYLVAGFKELARSTAVPTPALKRLYAYLDPERPPVAEGSAELDMDWRSLWISLGVLTGILVTLVSGWRLVRRQRQE